MCTRCRVNRVAWAHPRVDFCYDCLPGGPFRPPACHRCGSADYFSQGMCEVCHPGSPEHPGSCKGCLAWGVYRRHNWTCWSCRWWRTHYPEGVCDYCGRTTRLGDQQACRLCLEQARMVQEPGRALDLASATAHGQQLFLANMLFQRPRTPRLRHEGSQPYRRKYKNYLPFPAGTSFDDDARVQLTLFDMDPDPEVVRHRALVEDSDLTRYCASIVNEHAERFGWSVRQRNDVIRSLRLLQTVRATPTATIRASDVLHLPRYSGNITSTIDVLSAAGLLIEDRATPLEHYFGTKTATLPPVMKKQLEVWLQVMANGATSAPRQRARDPKTVQLHIMGIAPIVQAWAEAGHQSLAEITTEQVRQALPATGTRRHFAALGLRSLYKALTARRLVFTDPTRGIPATSPATTVPLPQETATIRQALNSPNPAVAMAVALAAFHALTVKQIQLLRLTDIVDGRILIDGRSIPLAAPVRTRLTAWLDHRARTWPGTPNPHLLINRKTAPRLTPVSRAYPWRYIPLTAQELREDRILNEIHAADGDVRRICDLFGLSVEGATRYLDTVEHHDLTRPTQ